MNLNFLNDIFLHSEVKGHFVKTNEKGFTVIELIKVSKQLIKMK